MAEALGTVGRYEKIRRIGRGGMAVVFLAKQTDLDRFVALKQLKVLDDDDPAYAQRFIRESRVSGSLSHPNIVSVFDYFEHDGVPFIAMELVRGGSLRPHIGELNLAQIGGVLEGVLAGLSHAEELGIVHRDLKPENLMVTSDGRVKIADFGIAKATTDLQTGGFKTATGTTVGTPTYMAPEQAMAQEIGPWTDLYSVGCIAFELFTGKPPFPENEAAMAILMRHVSEPIPLVTSIDPTIDPRIAEWIAHLLVKEPAQRTRSAIEAWEPFEEILIDVLGPRWRRQARVVEQPPGGDTPPPLTPAVIEGASRPYTPPPHDLPPGPLTAEDAYETYEEPPGWAAEPEVAPAPDVAPEPEVPPVPEVAPEPDVAPQPEAAAEPEAVSAAPDPLVAGEPTGLQPARTLPPTTPAPVEPDEPKPPARRRRVIALAAGAGLLVALAYLLAPASHDVVPTRADKAVAGSDVRFAVPRDWRTANASAEIDGLGLRSAVAATPGDAVGDDTVVAGLTDAKDPLLLPRAFVNTLTNRRPEPRPVRLDAGTALHYPDLRRRNGGAPLTVTALPTASGVATLVCRGASDSGVDRACGAITKTLAARSARTYPPPPRGAYAGAVNAAMTRMARDEGAAQSAAKRARTARSLAAALGRYEAAYRKAATAIGKIRTAPYEAGPTSEIRRQLSKLAATYGRLSESAGARRAARYEQDRRRAARLRAGLRERLEQLKALGYKTSERAST